jgi:Fe-S cluster assembly protein SufD
MKNQQNDRDWIFNLLPKPESVSQEQQGNWLSEYRKNALIALGSVSLPVRKQEAWRYTPTKSLFDQSFELADEALAASTADATHHFTEGLDAWRLVFINGRFSAGQSDLSGLPDAVRLGSLKMAMENSAEDIAQWFQKHVGQQAEVFELLNRALSDDGLFLHVAEGCLLEKPIEVVYLTVSANRSVLAQPRNLMVIDTLAEITLIEHFVSSDSGLYFNNNHSSIIVSDQARFSHYRIQDESDAAFHMGGIRVWQHGGSYYEQWLLSMGSAWSRTEIHADYQGEHAETVLTGLYLVADQQINDIHVNVEHSQPFCSSTEKYKGLLFGKGKAVFDGRIVVAKHAQKTEAHLSNANLMLVRGAEVDTKPQLEIFADDVKCSHGTTVGQIEDNQLFYLRSRGISEAKARAMLSMGFAGEIIEQLPFDSLRLRLLDKIENRLQAPKVIGRQG